MEKVIVVLALFVASCGMDVNVHIPDSNQNVNINLGYIQQLDALCRAAILPYGFYSAELYEKAIADCVLAHLEVGQLPDGVLP